MQKMNFCKNCGTKLNEDGTCGNCKNGLIKKKNNVFRIIFDIIRYIIGGLFIIANLTELPKIYGIFGIIFGISLFPIVYRKLIFEIYKKENKKIYNIISIILPVLLFIIWAYLLPTESQNYSENNNQNSVNKSEQGENKVLSQIISNIPDDASLDSYNINQENKYDVNIKYSKSQLSAYVCASDTQYYAKKFLGNQKINSIQFECINDKGTFNYVKIENIGTTTYENLNANTKYFDVNHNEISTTLEELETKQKEDFKISCQFYNYKDVMRNPNDYQSKNAYWFGKIVQVVSKTSNYSVFRIDVTCEKYSYSEDYYCKDTIYVTYFGNQSFIEDDMVKMWGTMNGTETYTTVLGGSVTIPKFIATYMELQ